MKSFQSKFKYAFKGIGSIIKDLGVRIQLFLMIVAICIYTWVGITFFEWIIVILCCGLVVIAEIINYIIECVMNYIHPKYDKEVGRIKDMSAGMVLFTCIVCAVIGGMILVSKLVG